MNTKELIKEVATSLDMPIIEVEKIFTSTVQNLIYHVQRKEKVSFGQLGKFSMKQMPERNIYDASIKQRKVANAKKKVVFKPSTHFKEYINI